MDRQDMEFFEKLLRGGIGLACGTLIMVAGLIMVVCGADLFCSMVMVLFGMVLAYLGSNNMSDATKKAKLHKSEGGTRLE